MEKARIAHLVPRSLNPKVGDTVHPLCLEGTSRRLHVELVDVLSCAGAPPPGSPTMPVRCPHCHVCKRLYHGAEMVTVVGVIEDTADVSAIPTTSAPA